MKRLLSVVLTLFLLLSLSSLTLAQKGRKARANQASAKVEVVTLKGEITNILQPFATFKSESKEYKVHLGPVWYWNQEKFKLEKGQAEILGEVEEVDGELHFYPTKMTQGKVEIVLASEDGAPKWAGRSARKGGRGSGRHHHGCGKCGSCRNQGHN